MIILTVLTILGVIFQGVAMFRSGWLYNYGVGYFGPLARDGVWHEALAGQLNKSIPPVNPGLAGQVLTNYHYFFDILVAKISQFTFFSPQFLIYRLFPVIFSILLGIGTYKLANILFKDKKTGLWAVFFAYFASSFGWIVSLAKHQPLAGESAFWANQPVSMNLNPPYAISLVIIIFSVILLDLYLKKPNFLKGFILSIAIGSLVGFKAYAGAICLGALFVLTLKKIFFDKNFSLLPVFIFSASVFTIIYLSISKGAAGLVGFQPLWLIDTMIDAGDRVGIPNFTARRFAYLGGQKWLHFGLIEIIGLSIFFIGNLGTRIVGLWGFSKKFFKEDLHLFIFLVMGVSIIPTLLFVQKGNPWNIIQFFYYFLYFAGLYAANSIKKFPVFLMVAIVLITPISSIATFRSWLYPNPPAYLSGMEYTALKYLSTQADGTVLKHPFDRDMRGKFKDPYPLSVYADNSYVSAYSGKSVYIEDVEQQIILNTDYETRVKNADRFFVEKDLKWSSKFLKDNDIRYVYLPKIYQLPMAEEEYPIKKIFENNAVNIYKVQ
ncbi:MAG: hypothetical protein HYV90_02745 [Candidatus Woesebacteria bacterium]|nr:MAG: hypothetical protein HYV90_02745 [Candidatus Woesebacteria bacterium]